ncbi:MAG: EamA/RhaT family transporter, partial [Verrucomicrobiota bacterium]
PLFKAPMWKIPKGVGVHIGISSVLIALQAVFLAFAIGYFSDPAGANIVYSSRGLWSVLMVWCVGHWFSNRESEAGKQVLLIRLFGASMIVAAIVLVFL